VNARKAPARLAIEGVLADGAWHTRDELVAAGAAAVPPGQAFRVGERNRQSLQRRRRGERGAPVTARLRGDDTKSIASGAHAIAADALRFLVLYAGERIEVDGDRYRLRSTP